MSRGCVRLPDDEQAPAPLGLGELILALRAADPRVELRGLWEDDR